MKKYLDKERAFEFIWQNADRDGIWNRDAASLAQEFEASEDAAHLVLERTLRPPPYREGLHTDVLHRQLAGEG